MEWLQNPDFTKGVLLGVALTLTIIASIALIFVISTDQYNLDHWKLNVRVPVGSLWMNLGFW